MKFKKLDSDGNYELYPGLTIVAHVLEKDSAFWSKIYELISHHDLLKKYYAPLPKTSYHMTTTNLFTEAAIGKKKWKAFVVDNNTYFKNLYEELQNQTFTPRILIKKINVSYCISLSILLTEEQKQIISNLAEKFNILNGIPNHFHMTLAYPYQPINDHLIKKIENELNVAFKRLIHKHGESFTLQSPTLCYFNDMLKFMPWDVRSFPFKDHPAPTFNEHSLFTTKQLPTTIKDQRYASCSIL